MFQHTGDYKKNKSDTKNETDFYTFTPSTLCNGLPMDIDDELITLLTTAHKLLGVLEGMMMRLPDNNTISKLFLIRESCYSQLIDYKDSPVLYDVFKGLAINSKELKEIINIADAQKYSYNTSVDSNSLSKIYNIILNGIDSPQQTKIRDKYIFFRNTVTNLKMYTPTAPEDILPAIADITRFLETNNNTDILVKAALSHYQFEMIHPFESCNGIVGRILVPMILYNNNNYAAPYLCLSEYLHQNKNEYFDKLSSTQMGRDYLFWIKFFIRAVCFSAEKSIFMINKFAEVVREDEKKVADLVKSTKHVIGVYDYYKRHLISVIKPISESMSVSFNTVSKAVNVLSDAGILQIENEQSRHRVFVYGRLVEVLV